MTGMAAMVINSKKPLKIFFSRTRRPMILKLNMKHQGDELYKVYIIHDPWMTLTYFTARSTQVILAFEWRKLSKCHLKGKTLWKWANGQNIYDSENMDLTGRSAPTPGQHVYYHNIQRSSMKPFGQSKPNGMWSFLRKGE